MNRTPTSIAAAIINIFARVPNPGFSRKGIQRDSTNKLTSSVALPIEISNCFETPCDKTVQGELPIFETIKSESPIPKRNKPSTRMANLLVVSDQGECAVHGVFGTVLLGRKNALKD